MTGAVRRRAFLGGLLLLPLAACGASPRPVLRLATGENGGFYSEFGRLLGAASGGRERGIDPVATGGSRENVELVARGAAAVGLAMTDVVRDARAGTPPFERPLDLLALGRVYENYLQLAVRADSPVTGLADLAGRPVSLGSSGSGAALAGARLFAVAEVGVQARQLSLAEATAALADGRIEAMMWSGGLPTPAVDALAKRVPIRLLPLADHIGTLRLIVGAGLYTAGVIPSGVYGSTGPVVTIGVPNLLVSSSELTDDDAAAIARLLVERAHELTPVSALGTQYLDQPSLIDTVGVPMHPGAAAAYREMHG
ncbi:TAXI family TRAP transporter solute-binding subunit [Pseudonocardia sp. NPDC049635]|uniref:TAXI family TRAP transporter solute-binding subunit n=1 Tax=Pseudonocardia sp. NPDC049635 TaxID=3155506 RepID=UPI0033D2016A